MDSRGSRDAEFQGGKHPNLHFNKLVSGVRIGSDVHEILHFWRTDLFKLRGDQHGSNTHQLQLPPWDRAAIEVLVDQTHRQEQSQEGGACSSLRRRPANRSGSPAWRSIAAAI